jgi:hypothetical protein
MNKRDIIMEDIIRMLRPYYMKIKKIESYDDISYDELFYMMGDEEFKIDFFKCVEQIKKNDERAKKSF